MKAFILRDFSIVLILSLTMLQCVTLDSNDSSGSTSSSQRESTSRAKKYGVSDSISGVIYCTTSEKSAEHIDGDIDPDYTYHEGGCPSSLAGEHMVGGCLNPTGSVAWFYTPHIIDEVKEMCRMGYVEIIDDEHITIERPFIAP